MSLAESIKQMENEIISGLKAVQSGIDHTTGKGDEAESIVEDRLLRPFLPAKYDCCKGAVVTSDSPDTQSPQIDSIIYDKTAAPPLVHGKKSSIFPIEAVCGLVQTTLYLDRAKLKHDIERMIPIKAMISRNFVVPKGAVETEIRSMGEFSARSYVIGLPADDNWQPETIAKALREIQLELGPPTHVHGLFVIGIGFFETIPIKSGKPTYRIKWWEGTDRLFRFSNSLRMALDRWWQVPMGWSAYLESYVEGVYKVHTE